MLRTFLLGILAVTACSHRASQPPPPPPTPPAPITDITVDPSTCAAEILAHHAIDVTPEPRICVPLLQAITSLGPLGATAAHGLLIVHDTVGPCRDRCTAIAPMLLSDAALAYYSNGNRSLHVTDATFDGPHWSHGTPSPEMVATYITGVGVRDWSDLVAHVRVFEPSLPAAPELGDPRVFDAIVRRGPALLLESEPALVDLVRHELGHAIQLQAFAEGIPAWEILTGWRETDGSNDGFTNAVMGLEMPIIASRLVLGVPRGEGSYAAPASGFPTGYAHFDPAEDFGESVRLAHADPVRLASISPIRLFIASAGMAGAYRDPRTRAGLPAALKQFFTTPELDGAFVAKILTAYGDTLMPEIATYSDPHPLPFTDLTDEERAELGDPSRFIVTIGGKPFRPTDAQLAHVIAEVRDYLDGQHAMERGLPK